MSLVKYASVPHLAPVSQIFFCRPYITVAVVFFFTGSSWLLLVVTGTRDEFVSRSAVFKNHVTGLCQSTGQVIPTPLWAAMKHYKEMLAWSVAQHICWTFAGPTCHICTQHICPRRLDVKYSPANFMYVPIL